MSNDIKVLIVDDQAAARMQLKRLPIWNPHSRFIAAGEARNGREALQILTEGDYQMVITDIRMPVMDGLELLQELVRLYPGMPVILNSDYAEFEYARKGLIYGAFDYILKPTDPDSLKLVMKRAAMDLDRQGDAVRHSPEVVAERIGRAIAGGALLSQELITHYGTALRSRKGIMQEDAYSWVRDGILGLMLQLPEVPIGLPREDLASLSGSWAALQPDTEEAFSRIVRFIEKAFGELMLPTIHSELIRRAVQVVLKDDGVPKTVGYVADALYVNRNHLSQTFSRGAGITLSDYILRAKMYMARVLLLQGSRSVQDVGEILGYGDEEHFSRLFRDHSGMLPREYRKIKR